MGKPRYEIRNSKTNELLDKCDGYGKATMVCCDFIKEDDKISLKIIDTIKNTSSQTIFSKKNFKLKSDWCEFSDDTCDFYSYPQDGECSCGVYKHHVHCIHGGIIQVG